MSVIFTEILKFQNHWQLKQGLEKLFFFPPKISTKYLQAISLNFKEMYAIRQLKFLCGELLSFLNYIDILICTDSWNLFLLLYMILGCYNLEYQLKYDLEIQE